MFMVHSGIPNALGIPEFTINIDKLGSDSWRSWRWLKRVKTCRHLCFDWYFILCMY